MLKMLKQNFDVQGILVPLQTLLALYGRQQLLDVKHSAVFVCWVLFQTYVCKQTTAAARLMPGCFLQHTTRC